MKIRFAVVLVLLSLATGARESRAPGEVCVRRSPTAPWIEVYHDGVLTSEWQPSDGAVYRSLELLLDDHYYGPPHRSAPRARQTVLAKLDALRP